MKKTWHLGVYSAYDFLNSNILTEDYVSFLLKKGIKKAVFLNVNSLFELLKFYQLAKKKGIEPVIGLTLNKLVYLQTEYEVTFLPKNFSAYQRMVKISSLVMSSDSAQFFLEKHPYLVKDFVIIITFFGKDNPKGVFHLLDYLTTKVGNEDVFLGLINLEFNLGTNTSFLKRMVAFPQVRFLDSKDLAIYQVLQAIKSQDKCFFNQDSKNYFWSFSFLEDKLDKNSPLLTNIFQILDKIQLDIPNQFDLNLKKISFPKTFTDDLAYLKFLCQKKLKVLKLFEVNEYQKRLNYELNIIKEKKLVSYFLIVADYVRFAVSKDILIGPGRGSASGSLISYLLGITKVDPIVYQLIFERFLNPERNKVPDIDIDVEDQKRKEVLDYLFYKYGTDFVSQVATFQKIAIKMAIRDVGRVLDIPLSEINKISKEIPSKPIQDFLKLIESKLSLQFYQKKYPDLFYFSQKIVGLPRQCSIHAAGLVITNRPILETVGVWKDGMKRNVLQAEMHDLSSLGLVKMDLLGLKNLTVVANVLEAIGCKENKNKFLSEINLEDEKTFAKLNSGNTTGIFQLESQGITQLLQQVQPKNIDDIAITISLYRPGPINNKELFLQQKSNSDKINYLVPLLKPVLVSTYGVPIYQEQIIRIITLFSDLSFAEAETLREALGKKNNYLLQSLQATFFHKAKQKNYSLSLIKEVWSLIFQFANYSFNRSHAISYSFLVYWMSYLKTNYFVQFMVALLNDVVGDQKKTVAYFFLLRESRKHICYPRLQPPTNLYQIDDKNLNLYCPLILIKGIGLNRVKSLVEEYEKNGQFIDVFDCVTRMVKIGFSKQVIQKIILSGAFNQFGYNSATLDFNLEKLLLTAKLVLVKKDNSLVPDWSLLEKKPELIFKKEQISWIFRNEIKVYGFPISSHFLEKFSCDKNQPIKLKEVQKKHFGKFNVVVLIEKIESVQSRKSSRNITFLRVSDQTNFLEKLIFLEQKDSFSNFVVGDVFCLEIAVSEKSGKKSYFLEQICSTFF